MGENVEISRHYCTAGPQFFSSTDEQQQGLRFRDRFHRSVICSLAGRRWQLYQSPTSGLKTALPDNGALLG